MKIQVEEKSLELAMVKAANKLGVTQSNLSYKILNKSSGFFGIFGKKICIEAWAKRSKSGTYDYTQSDLPEDLKEDLRRFLVNLCTKIRGEKVVVKADLDGERLVFDRTGRQRYSRSMVCILLTSFGRM